MGLLSKHTIKLRYVSIMQNEYKKRFMAPKCRADDYIQHYIVHTT
jgi:hypothetical protein